MHPAQPLLSPGGLRYLMQIAFIGLFLSGPGSLQAQELTGSILDSLSGAPVAYANVRIANSGMGTAADVQGSFRLPGLPAGVYTLRITHLGYHPAERRITFDPDSAGVLRIALVPVVLMAPELIVEREMLIGNPQRVHDTPGSAHYLAAEDLARLDSRNIHHVLAEIPGVNLQEEDGYGSRPNIGIRGSGAERTQKITVMEDGVLIAPAPYAAPAAYYFPTAGRMQAVEVRKGSSQIKYGPYTTAGALNLISTSIPKGFSGKADLIAGGRNSRMLHAYVGDNRPHFGFVAETYQESVDGFKELDNGGKTGFDKKDYLVKLQVRSSERAPVFQQLTVKAGQTDEQADETYLGLTAADFAITPFRRYAGSQVDRLTTEHRLLQARYQIRPAPWVDFSVLGYRTAFSRNWYKLDKVTPANGFRTGIAAILDDPEALAPAYALLTGRGDGPNRLDVKANNRSYHALGLQAIAGLQFSTGPVEHETEVGLRIHEDEVDRFQWVDGYAMEDGVMRLVSPGEHGTESNRIGRAAATAVFLEHRLRYHAWRFVPGVRFEHIALRRLDYGKADPDRAGTALATRSNTVDVVIPGFGIEYGISRAVQVFAGVHRGFSPPGSDAGVDPELSVNYEAGLRWTRPTLAAQVVLFRNDYQNLLGSDLAAAGGSGSGDQFNGGAAEVAGAEISLAAEARVSSLLQVPFRLSYALTDATFGSSFSSKFEPWGEVRAGDALPYVARHHLTVGAGVIAGRLQLDVRFLYQSRMRTVAGEGALLDSQSVPGRTIVNFTGTYKLARTYGIFMSVENLTGRVYLAARRPAGLRPGRPRSVSLGLRTTF